MRKYLIAIAPKTFLMLGLQTFVCISLIAQIAQPIEEAKKYIYYERFTKAEQILSAFLQNPKLKEIEIEHATFYLGRAYLLNNKIQEAKTTYRNTLKMIPASAINMVGLGSILLLEGNINEAQTLFDNAILQTKSKDIFIYTALAYAYTKSKTIDAKFAQNKFSLIPEKTKKNADYYIALGDFFKRLKYGNEVYSNYQLALAIESNNAAAKFRLGKLFLNQSNKDVFVQNMIDVTMLDKNFAPAFYELYLHYYKIDIGKSKEYFLKYKALVEYNPSLEFEEANILYASKDFKNSLVQSLNLINRYKEKVDIRTYRLIGYTYQQLQDSIKAISYLDTFFSKADVDIVDVENYRFMASLLLKFPNKTKEAITYNEKAYMADTLPINKMNDIKTIISIYKKTKNNKMLAYWSGMLYNNNPKQISTDLFNWGYASLIAEDYVTADSVFSTYINKYPNEYFGYFWKGRTRYAVDTSVKSAIPYYEKTISLVSQDTARYKNILVQSYGILYEYNRNKLKNYEESLKNLDMLVLYKPTDSLLINERNNLAKYLTNLKSAEAKKPKK